MSTHIYKIKFSKPSYQLNDDYDRLSEIEKEKISNMEAEAFFDMDQDDKYTFFIIVKPMELKAYLSVLNENFIPYDMNDVSDDILRGKTNKKGKHHSEEDDEDEFDFVELDLDEDESERMYESKKLSKGQKHIAKQAKPYDKIDAGDFKKLRAKKSETKEGAKPDFLDLDNDNNKTEPMKKAAADSTASGNYVNKARAKSDLTKKDCHVYGHDASGKATKLNSTSDVDNPKYKKFTIRWYEDGWFK